MNKEKCECKGKSTSTIETSNYFRRKQLIYTFLNRAHNIHYKINNIEYQCNRTKTDKWATIRTRPI